MRSAYEIFWKCGKVPFRVGYCEALGHQKGQVILVRPFCAGSFFTRNGLVPCRVSWPHDDRFPEGLFSFRESPVHPWMLIHFEELEVVHELCCDREVAVKLPRHGFMRGM